MTQTDICIVGAGVIGLSLALELEARGASVTVIDRGGAMSEASQAAAGMLAADDPENPPELRELSHLSRRLYPAFLRRIESLSGEPVPFQTSVTFQAVSHAAMTGSSCDLPEPFRPGRRAFVRLAESSIDPRQLAPALAAAVRNTTVRIAEHTTLHEVLRAQGGCLLETSGGKMRAGQVVHCMGAWSAAPVSPRKGQMLSVEMPARLALQAVVRTPEVYVVPRLFGPRAGQAVIGATVEDAGFSIGTDAGSLRRLRALAAELVPAVADERASPMTACWAGHRPHTPDHLPLLGPLAPVGETREWIATGHYRNGILLAPGTAHVMADQLLGKPPELNLQAFDPGRFRQAGSNRTGSAIFAHLP